MSGNYVSKSRNKLVAKAFKESGLIERYGSGIKRVRKICQEYGLKEPAFKEVSQGFLVVLYKEKRNPIEKITDLKTSSIENKDVTENVTEKRLSELMKIIEANPKITTTEISNLLEVTRRTIARDIEYLKNEGLLKRIGPDKADNGNLPQEARRDEKGSKGESEIMGR